MLRAALSVHAFPFPTRAPRAAQAPGITAKLNVRRGAGGSPAERNAFLKVTQAHVEDSVHPRRGLSPSAPAVPPTKPCPLTQEAGYRPPLYELAFGEGLRGGEAEKGALSGPFQPPSEPWRSLP